MTSPLGNDLNTQPTPRLPERGPLQQFFFGLKSLLKGMRITFRYFSHPSTVVTQQYPENRNTLKLADRVRAQLSMVHDENGFYKCTACHICEQACPNASIHVVERPKPAVSKVELDTFIWRLDSCTFCNLCVLVCPFQCLKMNATFESSVYDQRLLVFNLAKYAGPVSTVLLKTADPAERQKLIEPRGPYAGPVALAGFPLAGIQQESKS
ncbi:4Fe-4S binding protein [Bdellovibrionota bacterium FG-1]